MNIYIYGNHSFKKEIQETLEHSNIRFKLDDNTLIKEIDSIKELKNAIKNNPKDIYLIDDEKIIKKKSFKFLNPKDGIEEEFLLDSGIADLSVDSLKEIPKYIIKKFDEQKSLNPKILEEPVVEEPIVQKENKNIELDEELAMLLTKEESEEKETFESKSEEPEDEDLDDLFKEMNSSANLNELEDLIAVEPKSNDSLDFNDNFGLNNISFDYDDDDILNEEGLSDEDLLSNLLDENIDDEENEEHIEEVFEDVDFLEEIFAKKDKEKEKIEEELDLEDFMNLEEFGNQDFKSEDLLPIEDEDIDNIDFLNEFDKTHKSNTQPLEGEKMANDEFFELDSLNEKDLLEALNFTDSSSPISEKIESKTQVTNSNTSNSETLSIDSSNVNDLSLLISKLLNNKTLEITIKIKD